MTRPVVLRVDLPVKAAIQGLTGFELLAIQRRYHVNSITALGDTALTIGMVFSYARREDPSVTWDDVEAMTFEQYEACFAPTDPDPDSDQGKV